MPPFKQTCDLVPTRTDNSGKPSDHNKELSSTPKPYGNLDLCDQSCKAMPLLLSGMAQNYIFSEQGHLGQAGDGPLAHKELPRVVEEQLIICASIPFCCLTSSVTLTTDTSLLGWRAHYNTVTIQIRWTAHKTSLHMNLTKLGVGVRNARPPFPAPYCGKAIWVMSDNMSCKFYVNKASLVTIMLA